MLRQLNVDGALGLGLPCGSTCVAFTDVDCVSTIELLGIGPGPFSQEIKRYRRKAAHTLGTWVFIGGTGRLGSIGSGGRKADRVGGYQSGRAAARPTGWAGISLVGLPGWQSGSGALLRAGPSFPPLRQGQSRG